MRTTQANLAGLLGVQRSSVQRVLKLLETAGLIELHYRSIRLIDPGGLVSLLEEPDTKPTKPLKPSKSSGPAS